MAIERAAVFTPGPRFSGEKAEDGAVKVMFTHVIDAGNIVGPREATDEDKDAHPAEYADFLEGKTAKAEVEAAQAEVKKATEAAAVTQAAVGEAKKRDVERKAEKEKEAKEKAHPAPAKPSPADEKSSKK